MPIAARVMNSDLWRFLRTRHVVALAAGLVSVGLLDIMLGGHVLSFPGAGFKPVGVPMRRDLPMFDAILVAGSLNSQMSGFESAAGRVFFRAEAVYLWCASAVALLAVVSAQVIATDFETAILLCRALVIWLALAVISGRIFGRSLSWILPVVTVFPLSYLAQDSAGRDYWWDWTEQSAFQFPLWVVALVCAAVSVIAFSAAPWRLGNIGLPPAHRRRVPGTTTVPGRYSARSRQAERPQRPAADPARAHH